MQKWFDINSPFMRFLAEVGDLMIINVLFIVCSLPVITFGPSFCAMYTLVLRKQRGESRSSTVRSFFQAFRVNLKNGLILGILYTVTGAALYLNFLMLADPGKGAGLVYAVFWGIAVAVYFISFSHVFALQARFQNTVWRQIRNSLLFPLLHPLQTVSVTALTVLPVYLILNQPGIFLDMIPLWLLIGFSGTVWVNSLLLSKSFAQLEEQK